MGQILIRNLDAAVLAALRKRAAASGTSTEEQARRAFAKAVRLEREDAVRRLDEIRKKQLVACKTSRSSPISGATAAATSRERHHRRQHRAAMGHR